MDDIFNLLRELTTEEKAALVAGTDFMFTNPVPRLDVPQIRMSDGPHGLRVQQQGGDNGVAGSEPATAFPTAVLTACGWNEENLYKLGEAIGEEALHYGIDVVLGPGVNIKRNPLSGRNFEYFSDDPLIAGKLGAAEIKGIQSKGAGVALKHFALNNAENYRFMGDSVCDERAMREIYLKAFEIAVKTAKPETVMCAYNKINGTYCCQNKWLLNDVLRKEWGFGGLVMTDWGATHDRIEMLKAGLDLEMPGDTAICRKWIIDGIKSGELDEETLDKAVENVLKLVYKHVGRKTEQADFAAHDILAEEIAEDCAVLMKNDGTLPLSADKEYFVVGELFEKMRYQGSGSSMINPTFLTTPKNAFDNAGVKYEYHKGYKENKVAADKTLINEAVKIAEKYDTTLAFIGLTDYAESEGCDRENMCLPKNQLVLIDALIKAGKKVVVVLYGGSPVELPFAEKVSAILNMYLPGQRGGEATRKLLFGEKNPCGKLAETWAKSYSDVPYGDKFSKTKIEIYKESVFVGYRYYQKAKKQVAFPFGFGLSYTTFSYSDMQIADNGGEITVTAIITNMGERYGAEIIELYVKAPKTEVYKPEKELRGFTKVYLAAGESKEITITFKKSDLAYYNIKEKQYVLESGEYEIQLCSDSENVKLSELIKIDGENVQSPYDKEIFDLYEHATDEVSEEAFEKMSGLKIPTLPSVKSITLESRFTDMRATLLGKLFNYAVLSVARKDMKKAKKLPEGAERDNKIKGAFFLKRIMESNSIITMTMSAGRSFPYNFAMAFVNFANWHIIRGIRDICSSINAPALPKDENNNKEKNMQSQNPYLPMNVCIADGEPHVFGDRVYIFGSHDRAGGETFCELGYEIWSAPVNDLSAWKSHGTVYSAKQDPHYSERKQYLFAPDVCKGNDGRYYLYYSLGGWRGKHGYEGPISVAVSDSPAGKYEYLGDVRNPDGTPFRGLITFDPGVINDDGVIRLYFGTSYFFDEYKRFPTKSLYQFIESIVFDRTYGEIKQVKDGATGAYTVELSDDMLTVKGKPKLVVPKKTKGTEFEGHAFFEAASIRKFGNKYYFIYSSRNNHELCYAVSDYPDKGFSYGGIIVSNGDIGLNGRKRKARTNITGNNHGSIEKIGDKHYIFYHRMTDKSTYSRQGCAEEIKIDNDGKIAQVEITSQGLNGKPLAASGEYNAAIACGLISKKTFHLINGKSNKKVPYIAHANGTATIKDICNGTCVSYKYFDFNGDTLLHLKLRGDFKGKVEVLQQENGTAVKEIAVTPNKDYAVYSCKLNIVGKSGIWLKFTGKGKAELASITFQ